MEVRLMPLNITAESYCDPKPEAWSFRRSLRGGEKSTCQKERKIA